jgi:molybdopterin-guanine dinucleotide biosynthesis protein A
MVDGRAQPLCAVYTKDAISVITAHVATGNFSLMKMLPELNPCIINFDHNALKAGFKNFNTPQDLSAI